MKIPSHWALDVIGQDTIQHAIDESDKHLVTDAIGSLLNLQPYDATKEAEATNKVLQALEIAALESWFALIRPTDDNASSRAEAEIDCSAAFSIMRTLPLPVPHEFRVYHVLKLIAFAYVGKRWSDARRWIKEHDVAVIAPNVADVPWDKRILFRMFEAWICLVRKDGWNDLGRVAEVVAGLRKDQAEYEEQHLNALSEEQKSFAGWTLAALYHWAAATEMTATFLMQGTPNDVDVQIDTHFDKASEAARNARDAELEVLLRWLHLTARHMVQSSIWRIAHVVNSRVTKYVQYVTRRDARNLFELLPPQRAALLEQGLLDPAKRSIVINLPTSAGKTFLAIFRVLQALNQFAQDGGWVAYTAPTRALVAQQTRQLRKELGAVGIRVEQLSGAIEIDTFEDDILSAKDGFHVLVTTPEKLDLVIRQNKVQRPLALVVIDEAHNIQESSRGLKLELLLATVKRDCAKASFLLLTPFIPNAKEIAEWLSPDIEASASIGVTAWQPNERIVGIFHSKKGEKPRKWSLHFNTLHTTPGTMYLDGQFQVGSPGILDETFSRVSNTLYLQTAAMAKVFAEKPRSLVLAITTDQGEAWQMARSLCSALGQLDRVPDSIRLVQKFLKTEISPTFELCDMLEHGIAVHHSGLSDDARALIEQLAEENDVRAICATTTIAQGINFPVSAVFLASLNYPYIPMPTHDFWNLAGRAGRIFQESLGVIGIATKFKDTAHRRQIESYVCEKHRELVSILESLIDQVLQTGTSIGFDSVLNKPEWHAFWGYLAHIYNQTQSPESFVSQAERILRNTLGYRSLERKAPDKAKTLLSVTKQFGVWISKQKSLATLADATGFSPETLRCAIGALHNKVAPRDWCPEGLFGRNNVAFQSLMGIMLRLPEISAQLQRIAPHGLEHKVLAGLTSDWVNGASLETLGKKYFQKQGARTRDITDAISQACRAIYGHLCLSATWGLATLSKLPTSGIDFSKLDEEQKRIINALPAMIYYGVPTHEAVMMRMHSVPRSVAVPLGQVFKKCGKDNQTPAIAREFIRSLTVKDWQTVVPKDAAMTGNDYHQVWRMLTGESK
ncbi:MAG: DEAD/DEAH box helicase [Kiritimatiellae bacterium]|nr:DEAD/DEAH box helicase [Kiritimatiellia bacterium]